MTNFIAFFDDNFDNLMSCFIIIIMNSLHRKSKSSLKNLKTANTHRSKNNIHSNNKTPKHLDSTIDNRTPLLSKFKTQPNKYYRQLTCSILPLQTQIEDAHRQTQGKVYESCFQIAALPFSQSEKTIKRTLNDKCNNKNSKQSKGVKTKKHSKCDNQLKSEGKGGSTTRKNSLKKGSLQTILMKTERILKSYQRKQEQWQKQRLSLMQELNSLKRMSNTKTMTSSASAYLNKKHLF